MKKLLSILIPTLMLSGCAVGYNKTVGVTVIGTHQLYSVPEGSEVKFPDGTSRKIVEDSTLTSDHYFQRILKAKVKYETNEKDENEKEEAGDFKPADTD